MKLIGNSIVLVESEERTLSNSTPFVGIDNEIILTKLIYGVTNKVIKPSINVGNPLQPVFIFENIVFQFLRKPCRLAITHGNPDKNNLITTKIFNDILEKNILINNISLGALGINFEFFLEEEKNKFFNKIFQTTLADETETANLHISFKSDGKIKVTMVILNAVLNNKAGFVIKFNYHYEINSEKNLKNIVANQNNLLLNCETKINNLLKNHA